MYWEQEQAYLRSQQKRDDAVRVYQALVAASNRVTTAAAWGEMYSLYRDKAFTIALLLKEKNSTEVDSHYATYKAFIEKREQAIKDELQASSEVRQGLIAFSAIFGNHPEIERTFTDFLTIADNPIPTVMSQQEIETFMRETLASGADINTADAQLEELLHTKANIALAPMMEKASQAIQGVAVLSFAPDKK